MADDATCNIVCLIEGESSSFEVTPTWDTRIRKLKKLIRKDGINADRDVLAKDLTLWKVRMTIASDSTNNSLVGSSLVRRRSAGEPQR
jgi:hypothetical protein